MNSWSSSLQSRRGSLAFYFRDSLNLRVWITYMLQDYSPTFWPFIWRLSLELYQKWLFCFTKKKKKSHFSELRLHAPIPRWRALLYKQMFPSLLGRFLYWSRWSPAVHLWYHEMMRCTLPSYQLTPGGPAGPQEPLTSWPEEKNNTP